MHTLTQSNWKIARIRHYLLNIFYTYLQPASPMADIAAKVGEIKRFFNGDKLGRKIQAHFKSGWEILRESKFLILSDPNDHETPLNSLCILIQSDWPSANLWGSISRHSWTSKQCRKEQYECLFSLKDLFRSYESICSFIFPKWWGQVNLLMCVHACHLQRMYMLISRKFAESVSPVEYSQGLSELSCLRESYERSSDLIVGSSS